MPVVTFSPANEPKKVLHHWDSALYPHGNLISKGKWASEYNDVFEILHKKYKINKNLRGTT